MFLVIGGGNTLWMPQGAHYAADYEYSADTIVYRRTEIEMPVRRLEIDAKEEGVKPECCEPERIQRRRGGFVKELVRWNAGSHGCLGKKDRSPLKEANFPWSAIWLLQSAFRLTRF